MPSAPSGAAKEAINLPSLFVIILGVLGVLLFLSAMLSELAGGSMKMAEALMKSLPPDQQEQFRTIIAQSRSSGGGGVFGSLLGIGLSGLTVFGGLQMRALKSWGLALASAILVMTPCGSYCCCCIGIPIGIWALVTLTKPEVKSAFS